LRELEQWRVVSVNEAFVEIRTNIAKQDVVALRLYQLIRTRRERIRLAVWALILTITLAGAAFWLIAHYVSGPVRAVHLLPLLLIPVLCVIFLHRLTIRRLASQLARSSDATSDQSSLGESLITISEGGVSVLRRADTLSWKWSYFSRVVVDGDYAYLFTHRNDALIIPQTCFQSYNSFRSFVKLAVIYHWQHQAGFEPAGSEGVPPPPKSEPPIPFCAQEAST
jgi:hypothetical protein